jgi:MoaA/NifB/PqqE/SkfB family radical SAM enzyme
VNDLEQVFLYVTQHCNIRCVTCYALDQLERDTDLAFDDLVQALRALRGRGAWRLSFLGGEPTVYNRLGEVTAAARDLGFSFVRVNTNGMFAPSLFDRPILRGVDVLCFSVDGATAAVNDSIRQGSRLAHVAANMRTAASRGFDVRANVTITSRNIGEVFDIIRLVEDAGGREVNLNVMFMMGYANSHRALAVAPPDWRATYEEVLRRHREFRVRIKLPPAFAASSELADHRRQGHHAWPAIGDAFMSPRTVTSTRVWP